MSVEDDDELGRRAKAALNSIKQIGSIFRQAIFDVTVLVDAFIAHVYFFHWYLKEIARRTLRVTAVGFLLASSFLLALEVLLHVQGEKILDDFVELYPNLRWYLLLGFLLAVLIVILHGWRELRNKKIDFAVSEALWQLCTTRSDFTRGEEFLDFFLPRVVKIFESVSAVGACVWIPDPANSSDLYVPQSFKFPASLQILDRMSADSGVAGLALETPHYVPRTFFPFNVQNLRAILVLRLLAYRFPHALRLKTGRDPKTKEFTLSKVDVRLDKVASLNEKSYGPFKSFVAAPLVPQWGEYKGVLCIHFAKTDPLDRVHIKVAAMLAVLIADQLEHLQRNPPARDG